MTFEDLIDEIVGQVGGDADDTALRAKMLVNIKSALRRFPTFSKDKVFQEQKSGTLTSGSRTMALPAGIVEVSNIYCRRNDRNELIEQPGEQVFNSKVNASGSGYPLFAIIRGSTVEFDQAADQNYTIYFESFIEIDDVEEADTWIGSSSDAETLKDGAKYYYYLYQEEGASLAAEYKSNFITALNKMEIAFSRKNTPNYVEEA